NVLAKALYDNVAESPDELSFRKGDIMTVLERNTQGLDGWWLCSLHGRQGIVPGNRLKILVGMYDKKQQQAPGPAQGQAVPQPPVPQPALPYHHQGGYTPLSPASQYTPMHPAYAPQGDNDVYQVPPSAGQAQDIYQVPPSLDTRSWEGHKPQGKVGRGGVWGGGGVVAG
ncbi:Breast cancer anti-estrogen resistance protein 1, partial [Charadrius vociferus]